MGNRCTTESWDQSMLWGGWFLLEWLSCPRIDYDFFWIDLDHHSGSEQGWVNYEWTWWELGIPSAEGKKKTTK